MWIVIIYETSILSKITIKCKATLRLTILEVLFIESLRPLIQTILYNRFGYISNYTPPSIQQKKNKKKNTNFQCK